MKFSCVCVSEIGGHFKAHSRLLSKVWKQDTNRLTSCGTSWESDNALLICEHGVGHNITYHPPTCFFALQTHSGPLSVCLHAVAPHNLVPAMSDIALGGVATFGSPTAIVSVESGLGHVSS